MGNQTTYIWHSQLTTSPSFFLNLVIGSHAWWVPAKKNKIKAHRSNSLHWTSCYTENSHINTRKIVDSTLTLISKVGGGRMVSSSLCFDLVVPNSDPTFIYLFRTWKKDRKRDIIVTLHAFHQKNHRHFAWVIKLSSRLMFKYLCHSPWWVETSILCSQKTSSLVRRSNEWSKGRVGCTDETCRGLYETLHHGNHGGKLSTVSVLQYDRTVRSDRAVGVLLFYWFSSSKLGITFDNVLLFDMNF